MPLTEEQVTASSLWAAIDALEQSLADAGSIVDDDVARQLALVPMMSAEVRALRSVPHWRFPTTYTGFADIQTQVDAITQAITTVSATEDEAQAAAATTQLGSQLSAGLDAITTQLNAAPRVAIGPEESAGITEAVRRMGELVAGRSKELRAQQEQLSEQIAQRRQELADLQSTIEQAEAGVAAQVGTLETAVNQMQNQHQSQVEEWQGEHEARLTKHDAEAKAERAAEDAAAKQLRDELTQRSQATLDALDKLHEEAKSVVSKTAERVTVSDFEEYADRREVVGWRWAAATVVLGVAAVALVIFFVSRSHDDSFGLAALKTGGSFALLGLMAFTGQQVRHHQREATDARGIALSVKAVGPFMADMDIADQRRIKEAIAMELFVRRFAKGDTATPGHSTNREPPPEPSA